MSSGDLLNIGVMAMASGLSINALRHYDELGLLRPAVVDPATGYRRYRPEQIRQARLIGALRRVDVPLDAVRAALAQLVRQSSISGVRRVPRSSVATR